MLWFAFILVSLNHWKQLRPSNIETFFVVICFHFSIFEPLETTTASTTIRIMSLWFAFILVSLNHWKQLFFIRHVFRIVVICFHFSIFEPLETTYNYGRRKHYLLWFAFILVSLNHWKQLQIYVTLVILVVICFHFSIFEPLETTLSQKWICLW